MKRLTLLGAMLLVTASGVWSAKQKIIVRLREPLKAESVKIRLPEVKNSRGQTRDLETRLELGDKPKQDASSVAPAALKLNMSVKPIGKTAVQVTLSLPKAGFVELVVLDFYGKNLGTLLSAQVGPGMYTLKPFTFKEGDNNGIKFMTLRINGKVVMKRLMSKVR